MENNNLTIITDRDETTDRDNEFQSLSPQRENKEESKVMDETLSPAKLDQSIDQIESILSNLNLEVDWEILKKIENLVDNFVQNSQIFFDQAQHAVTKQKERESIEIVFKDIQTIDEIMGKFEVQLNLAVTDIMNNFISDRIASFSQECLNHSKQDKAKFEQFLSSDSAKQDKEMTKADSSNTNSLVFTTEKPKQEEDVLSKKSFDSKLSHQDKMELRNTNLCIQQIIMHTTQQFKKTFDSPQSKSSVQNQTKFYKFKDFNEQKLIKTKQYLLKQIEDVIADLKQLQRTQNPNQKKQKNIHNQIQKLKEICEDPNQDLLNNYQQITESINKQFIDIHKEKHLFQMWKLQQVQPVSDEKNMIQKEKIISEILKDLDKHIGYIDYELEEMKEQQLCVDLSIEKYYKKVAAYPKGLKKLFDQGTHLLNMFDQFYQSWYCFQCDIQQKLYNQIYSNDQKLLLHQLQSGFQLKQLDSVIAKFHNKNEEFHIIKSKFQQFKIEIETQNMVLYKHSYYISQNCQTLFEKIGILDMQGCGTLIKNTKHADVFRKSHGNKTPDQAESPDQSQKPSSMTKALSQNQKLGYKYSPLDEESKQLCFNVHVMDEFTLAIQSHFLRKNEEKQEVQSDRDSIYLPNYFDKTVQPQQRHSLKYQMGLSFEEYLAQQFDQIFSYSVIQNFMMSTDSNNKDMMIDKPKKSKTLSEANNGFISKIDKSDNDVNSFDTRNISVNKLPSDAKDFVEFDLIINICGLELNVISLKKQVKVLNEGAPQRSVDVFRKELFLNLNYVKKPTIEKQETRIDQDKIQKFSMKQMLSPTSAGQSGFFNSFNAINSHLLCNELSKHEQNNGDENDNNQSQSKDHQKYYLVPFGLAIHHILQSENLALLFEGLKQMSVKQIDHMIKVIEHQIDKRQQRRQTRA